jgi:hypothetical protein
LEPVSISLLESVIYGRSYDVIENKGPFLESHDILENKDSYRKTGLVRTAKRVPTKKAGPAASGKR